MISDLYQLAASTAAAVPSLGGPAEIWAHIVNDFSNITSPAAFTAFLQVLMIDIVLAGDNAIVVGALAAGLPADQRKKVIAIGVIAALVLRVAFALMVTWLLGIVGLVLAGGILLLWVAWRMYRPVRRKSKGTSIPACPRPRALPPRHGRSRLPTFRCALITFWPWPARRANIPAS